MVHPRPLLSCFIAAATLGAALCLASCSDDSPPPAGGTSGAGGAGGAGGGAGFCVRTGDHFRLVAEGLCVDRFYDLPAVTAGAQPTWGQHDGLLTLARPNSYQPRLYRWRAVDDFHVSELEQEYDFYQNPDYGEYLRDVGPVAADIPGTDSTAFGWVLVDTYPPTAGHLLVVRPGGESVGYPVVPDGVGAVEVGGAARVLYTGAADLAGQSDPGLYVADVLVTAQGVELAGGGLVHGFPEGRGIIATDAAGNALVRMGPEIHGLAADQLVPGGGPGIVLGDVGQSYHVTLAARAPSAGAPGLAVYQAQNDAEELELTAIEYTADGAGLAAGAAPRVIATGTAMFHAAFDPGGDLWLIDWAVRRFYLIKHP